MHANHVWFEFLANPQEQSSTDDDGGLSTGAIVGIIVGALVGVLVVVVIIIGIYVWLVDIIIHML